MQKLLFCRIVLIMILAVIFSSRSQAKQSVRKLQSMQEYERVLRLIGDHQYEQAIQGLKQIIRQDASFYRAYFKLVEVYKYQGAINEAKQYFENLVAKNSKNAYVEHGLGLVYQVIGDFQHAILNYRKSIELGNSHAAVYRDIVDAYKKEKNLKEVINYLSDPYTKSPNAGIYYGLGYAYMQMKQWEKALAVFDKALELDPNLLEGYLAKANVYFSRGMLQQGLKVAKIGFRIARQNNDIELEHSFLGTFGKFFGKLGKFQRALENFRTALGIAREIGDRRSEGRYLGNMGIIFANLAQYNKALGLQKQAIKIATEVGDKKAEVTWLNGMGYTYRNLGQYEKALAAHQRALEIAQQIGDRKWESLNIGNIGTVYLYLSQISQALKQYELALQIDREIRDNTSQGTWLTNIGLCYWHLGNYRKALAYYQQALTVLREIGDKSEEGRTLGAIGLAMWKLGNYSEALEYYDQAISIARKIGDRNGESRWLANMGNIFNDLGRFSVALEYYNRARRLANEIGDKSQEGVWIGNIGMIYYTIGNYSKALEYYKQSLEIVRGIGSKINEGIFLGNVGAVYEQSGDLSRALKFYTQALKIARETKDKNNEGYQLNNLGSLNLKMKRYAQSVIDYRKALEVAQEITDPAIIWEAHAGLGAAYEKTGQYSKSLDEYKLAVKEIESVRNSLQFEEQKSGFFENRIQIYAKLIHLLSVLDQKEPAGKYASMAFEYAERAKARALLDMIYEGKIFHNLSEIPEDVRNKFLKNEKELEKKHTDLSNELAKVEPQRDANLIFTLNSEINALQTKKAHLLEKIKRKFPRYHQLTNPKTLTAEEVQREILDDNQILIEYLVGQQHLFVWALTKSDLKFRALDLTRGELEDRLAQISPLFQKEKAAQDIQIDHRWANIQADRLHDLYQILIEAPVGDVIKPGMEVIIVPDGVLHYFPFEILVTELKGNTIHYWVETHPISYAASASLLNPKLEWEGHAGSDFLAFGNPDFGSEQSKGIITWVNSLVPFKSILRGTRFEPLPYSELEVEAIAENFSDRAVLTGRQASEARFKKIAPEYRFIHLATHNITDDRHPMYSKIILAQTGNQKEDGYLQTYEVYNLRLNADLVVLSGCNTGLGRLSRGEGIIGMARAFLYAGAPSLVVSLWPVKDESTAELMKLFYRNLKAGMPKNQALQKTKVELIRAKGWKRDPFYWGAFVLIGDWKAVKME